MPDAIPQPYGLDVVVGTRLEPFLRGFQECGFRHDVEQFVEKYAPAFRVACPDGSQPLVWTEIHREYRSLFDAQLETILEYHEDGEIERDEFLEYCSRLADDAACLDGEAELPGTMGVRAADFKEFMQALTASEDYLLFLQVMFQEVSKLCIRDSAERPDSVEADANLALEPASGACAEVAAVQEIEVVVPEGYGAGQLLPVDYLGCRYELEIPEGCGPSSSFRVVVQVSSPNA
eukprot:gnl/TRDRNA2_/TRDRNA2_125911_c0_seq1.p1 gnl/TRDRNA2_/TRDRNA2_125911_c0~~gnl/TRDRNA2_/TRDRNA2_125911_c0_seq1.p1  ORF type:complete len:234 (+),score=35.54 gnl/TRDRNA2_/TRDRNA2_125911_c0_seq1:131-832(+)